MGFNLSNFAHWVERSSALRRFYGRYEGSRHARWAMASQIVTSGANFATTLIIVSSFGLEEFGRFSICFLLMMVVRNFLTDLVLVPMSSIGPKLSGASNAAYRGFLTINSMVFSIGLSLLLLMIAQPLGILLNAPWLPSLGLVLALTNLTANAADFLRRYHFVYDAPVWAFAVDAVRYSVQLGLLAGFALTLPSQFSASYALLALGAGGLVATLIGALHFGRIRWSSRFNRRVWPRHKNFIKWMVLSVVLETFVGNAPLIIGGAILGETALGLVRAMQSLANFLNLPFNAIQQIATSMGASEFARGGRVRLSGFLKSTTAVSLVLLVLLTLTILSVSDMIIGDILKIRNEAAIPILLTYCLLNLTLILKLPFVVTAHVIEYPLISVAANLVSTFLVLAGASLLISYVGPLGVPLVNIAVSIASSVTFIIFLSKLKN